MNNKIYIKLKHSYEVELSSLTKKALTRTDISEVNDLIEKIHKVSDKLLTLDSLFKKINLDENGNHVLKDSDGSIQWKF